MVQTKQLRFFFKKKKRKEIDKSFMWWIFFRCLSLNKSQYIIVWKERRFTYMVLASLLDLAEALVSRSEIDNWRQFLLKMPVSKNKILVKASTSDFLLSMLFIAVLRVSRLRNFQHHYRNDWFIISYSMVVYDIHRDKGFNEKMIL